MLTGETCPESELFTRNSVWYELKSGKPRVIAKNTYIRKNRCTPLPESPGIVLPRQKKYQHSPAGNLNTG